MWEFSHWIRATGTCVVSFTRIQNDYACAIESIWCRAHFLKTDLSLLICLTMSHTHYRHLRISYDSLSNESYWILNAYSICYQLHLQLNIENSNKFLIHQTSQVKLFYIIESLTHAHLPMAVFFSHCTYGSMQNRFFFIVSPFRSNEWFIFSQFYIFAIAPMKKMKPNTQSTVNTIAINSPINFKL